MNPDSIVLRPLTEADYPFLEQLYASTREEEMALAQWPPAAAEAFLRDQCRLQHIHYTTHYHHTSFDVVLVDGVCAGRLYVGRWEKEMRVVDISILPAFQRQGLGQQLMMDLLAEADEKGQVLSLHVECHNRARHWYPRFGFQEVESNGIICRMERQATC